MAWSIDIESGKLSGPSGYHHYLVVQPERRRVYVFGCVGSGTPMDVWHRRATTLRLPIDVDGEQVASVLRSHTEELDKIAAAYLGERCDGRDLVGRWDEGADYRDAEADIERDLEELPTYWDAGDWIRPDGGYTLRYSVREAAQALVAGQSLADWAAMVCDDNAADALVDPVELADAIKLEVREDPALLIADDNPYALVEGAGLLAAEVGIDCPALPACECTCSCGARATHGDEGAHVCDDCGEYCEIGGDLYCARETEHWTECPLCEKAIEWGRIATGAYPGAGSLRVGDCGCGPAVWENRENGGNWDEYRCRA